MIDKKKVLPEAILPSESVFAFIDKPESWTSHDCVNYLRRAFKGVKMGHGGTLDPFATGILPIFFNEWTRLSELFSMADKRYQADITLGTRTDTGDHTGKVIEKKSAHHASSQMSCKLLEKSLVGPIKLPVPIYSALKVDGKPMHALARQGVITEPLRYRRTTLYAVSLVQKSADCLSLDVTCSHGTYIRSLGEYIASRLKTCGHLSQLRRVAYYHDSRPYDNPVATLDALIQDPAQYVVTLSDLPKYLPSYDLPLTELRSFLTGKWRRASLKLEGWWLVQVAQRSIGVVFFENGKVTQRLFMPQKNAAITIPQIAVPHKCSRYD